MRFGENFSSFFWAGRRLLFFFCKAFLCTNSGEMIAIAHNELLIVEMHSHYGKVVVYGGRMK